MNQQILQLQKKARQTLQEEKYSEAINIYEHCIETEPEAINNYWYLGLAHLLQGDEETAEAVWMSVFLQVDDLELYTSELVQILASEGEVQFEKDNLHLAKIIYEKIKKIAPKNIDNYQNLAYIYQKLNDLEQAEVIFRKIIAIKHNNFKLYLDFTNLLFKQHRLAETIDVLRTAIDYFPDEPNLYLNLMRVLKSFGNAKEASEIAERGLKLCSDYLPFQLENGRILPILYESQEEIDYYRQRFITSLDKIINNLSLDSEEDKKYAQRALSSETNFYLQYQGKNDLIIQKKYGNFVHKIMKSNYPQWSKNIFISSLKEKDNIRIGFLSTRFRDTNLAIWLREWIAHLNRQEFLINCYYLRDEIDEITHQFYNLSDNFYHIPSNLEQVCQQIINDQIQILIYTDIGMDAQMTLMAALRLAPIQCAALGHPITSGLPTIDYYLSRVLMEPDNGQEHYTEKLVLLPNLGICIPKPKLPETLKSRSEFNLNEEAIIYLCCQSLFKYLPQYDYIFPLIAQQVPQAKFVFIEFPLSSFVNEQFKNRLKKAFTKYALNSEDYCSILSRLNEEEYASLNLVADIFLDTFTWSGDNTTRMAIACNLPVVTRPGEFMRGRHSYGILKMLGVEDTIAYSEEEYIDIAVKLGNNCHWRQSIVDNIYANQDKIFNDRQCLRGLEEFLRNVVKKAADG